MLIRTRSMALVLLAAIASPLFGADAPGLPKPAGSGLSATPGSPHAPKVANPAQIAARASKLVDQGGAALQAGDAQAALENFLDAKLLLERQHVRIDPSNPVHFAILEGVGTAYMAIGRYEKAGDPLER